MRDYWLTQYILAGVGWVYIIATLIAIGLALWLPKGRKAKAVVTAVVIGLASILPIQGFQEYSKEQQAAEIYKARLAKGRALFAERCKTAGEKIYKTVDDVEGILLVNPRPERGHGERADRDWMGAGFPHESGGNQYIMEFLYFNEPASGNKARGLGWIRKGIQGYPYVDIEEQGQHFRYRLVAQSEYKNLSDPVKDYGSKEIVTTDYPRYAVTHDNIPDPEGRANWVAGGRVTVVDRANNELLGEFIRYAFEPGLGNTGGQRSPWGFAQLCPVSSYGGGPGHIRSFVEQVLRPKQGK